ncbi:MAG: proline--tRNA ligase [Firmicutes bacterium]|nr:proline--tRNA ligase [Bacillota bacterium]
MRISQMLAPTLRETPAEAEVISHKLLLRAGMIRKTTAGVYTYLPLGQRVIKKIIEIVREEMDRAGGQEVGLPIIQPAELWQETGRWAVYGEEMFRLKDRHQRDFCLGPTHEEIITDLVRGEVRSYKQLPLLLYQVQNKYRDERRPRFGLMRGREFIMKDLYSFDVDADGLEISYRKMYDAYCRVFTRCGLRYRAVEADPGAIGGNASHEFMVLAESGEAEVVFCQVCDYAANVEKAECQPQVEPAEVKHLKRERVFTPGVQTVEEVANFFKVSPKQVIKTLFYQADDQVIAVLLRGDRRINETKLKNLVKCLRLELADDATVERVTGAPPGSVGPIGLTGIKVYADLEVPFVIEAIVGANQVNYHWQGITPGVDFSLDVVADLRTMEAGEPCPKCASPVTVARGIEVGHIFKLGTKYSEVLGAKFLNEKGQELPMVMGCYGIGVSRTMAAAVEQNYDQDGIKWPMPIAPFHVIVVPVSTHDAEQMRVAEELYQGLLRSGLEVVVDDRNERAGVKFKDADLIGYPIRVTVGAKALKEGQVEVKKRQTGEQFFVPLPEAVDYIAKLVKEEIQATLSEVLK